MLQNVVLLLGARALLIAGSLVATPIVLHRLGTEAYGVFVLTLVVNSSFGAILDLGFRPGLTTLASGARGDRARLRAVLGTGLSVYLVLGAAGGIALWIAAPALVSLLHVPGALAADARLAFEIAAVSLALAMCLAPLSVVPAAFERYDLVAPRIAFGSLAFTALLIAVALATPRLPLVVAVSTAGGVFNLALQCAAGRGLAPFPVRPSFDGGVFRNLLRFGAFKSLGTMTAMLFFRFDQIVIGAYLGAAAAGMYAVPANAVSNIHGALVEAASPALPRASHARGSAERLRGLFLNGTRLITLLAVPAMVEIFVLADSILRYWIHGAQGDLVSSLATPAMRWLAAAFLIQAMAAIAAAVTEGLGRPEINNGFAVASGLIHVPLVLILVPRFGITGAAIAVFINSASQTLLFVAVAAHTSARIRFRDLLGTSLLRPVVAGGVAGIALWILRPAVHDLWSLVAVAAAGALVYVAAAVAVRAVSAGDAAYLQPITRSVPAGSGSAAG